MKDKSLGIVDLIGGPLDGKTHNLLSVFGIGMFPSVIKLPTNGPGSELACYRLDDVSEQYHFIGTEEPRLNAAREAK